MSKDYFGKLDATSKEDIKEMEKLLKEKYENELKASNSDSKSKKVTA